MVENDTEEGSGGKHWIDRTERAVLNTSADVAGKEIMKGSILLTEKHIGQFMPFQGAEKEQAKQCRIGALSDPITGKQRKEPRIILIVRRFLDGFS